MNQQIQTNPPGFSGGGLGDVKLIRLFQGFQPRVAIWRDAGLGLPGCSDSDLMVVEGV